MCVGQLLKFVVLKFRNMIMSPKIKLLKRDSFLKDGRLKIPTAPFFPGIYCQGLSSHMGVTFL